jgi:hypothetical protein
MTARADAVAAKTGPLTGVRARDVGRMRQPSAGPARPVAPTRNRTPKKSNGQPEDKTEDNRALRAITDI